MAVALMKPRALCSSFLSSQNCYVTVGKECGALNVMKEMLLVISRVKKHKLSEMGCNVVCRLA